VHDLDGVLVGRLYEDVVVTNPTSPDPIFNISPDPLDAFHVSSSCSLPSPSPKCHNISLVNHHDVLEGNVDDYVESLGTFRGYNSSLDPYSLYLGNMLCENHVHYCI